MKTRILVILFLFSAIASYGAQQIIGIGAAANDRTGDPPRTVGEKVNANFTELYGALNTYIPISLGASKGDILAFTGSAWTVLHVGTNGYVITADSTQTSGVKWSAPSSSYDPTNVAITGGTIWNSGAGSGTPPIWLKLYTGSLTAFSVANDGSIVSASTLQLAGQMRSYGGTGTTLLLDGNNAVFTPNAFGQGVVIDQGPISFNDMGSAPSTPSGALIYSTSGEMHVIDNSGNDTIISPHAKDAPASLYETGPGADEMEGKANVYLGVIQWSAVSRRKRLDYLDMTARLGSPADSSAAWTEVLQRQTNNQILCYTTETFAEYATRTGRSRWPNGKASTWPAMTPSQRWTDAQNDLVAASQVAHSSWSTAKSAAQSAGKSFTTPEPMIYTAQAAPVWCTP